MRWAEKEHPSRSEVVKLLKLGFPLKTGGTFTVFPKVIASYFSKSGFMRLEEGADFF